MLAPSDFSLQSRGYFVWSFVFSFCPALAQNNYPLLKQSLDKLLQDSLSTIGNQCGLIIPYNDSVVCKKYFGGWNHDTYIPIASASKMPSMGVMMALVDEGKIFL